MTPERLLKLLPAFEAGLKGVRDSFGEFVQSGAIFQFSPVTDIDAEELKVLFPPQDRQPVTVLQQRFSGPATGHISGILTDKYSDQLSVALGSQEGLSAEESMGMRTDILSELGNVVANRFLTEWTLQSGVALNTDTPTCHNVDLNELGGLLGPGPFLSSIAAYRIDRTGSSGQWLFVVSACLETIQ